LKYLFPYHASITVSCSLYCKSSLCKWPKAIWIAAFSTLITIATGYAFLKCSKKQRGKEAHKLPPFGVPEEVPEYIYQPLGDLSLKTIRLIELLPFDPDQPHTGIQIRLRTTSLAVPVPEKYEAISYCWGDASDVRSIYCNGSKLGSQHLYATLLYACPNFPPTTIKSEYFGEMPSV
jgi:hypothetical protein